MFEKANFTPTRSWINSVLEDLEAHIRSQVFVDSKRLEACSYSEVNNFYTTFGSIIKETERALIFTVDATMIETQPRRKKMPDTLKN